jgi:N-glycosylase/DNA lyase
LSLLLGPLNLLVSYQFTSKATFTALDFDAYFVSEIRKCIIPAWITFLF